MICGNCGAELTVGSWPFCPHGRPLQFDGSRCFTFENYVDTNVDTRPVEITSQAHRRRLMRQNKLEEREREHISDLNHRRWKLGLPPLPK